METSSTLEYQIDFISKRSFIFKKTALAIRKSNSIIRQQQLNNMDQQSEWANHWQVNNKKSAPGAAAKYSRHRFINHIRDILWFSGKRHHVNLCTESSPERDIKGNNGDVSVHLQFVTVSVRIRDSLKDQQKVPLAHNYRHRSMCQHWTHNRWKIFHKQKKPISSWDFLECLLLKAPLQENRVLFAPKCKFWYYFFPFMKLKSRPNSA